MNLRNIVYVIILHIAFINTLLCSHNDVVYHDKYIYVISRFGLFGCKDLDIKIDQNKQYDDAQIFDRNNFAWRKQIKLFNGNGLIHIKYKSDNKKIAPQIVIQPSNACCWTQCIKNSIDNICIKYLNETYTVETTMLPNPKTVATLYNSDNDDEYLLIISNSCCKSVITDKSEIYNLCTSCKDHQAAAYCYCCNYVDCNLDKNSYKELVLGNDTDDAQSTLEYQDNVNDHQNIVNLDDAQSV